MLIVGKKRRQVKNNSRYTKLIHAQGKIIASHPKIIHGSFINYTYTKIDPDIYDINYYRQKNGNTSKIIQGTKN